VFGRLNLMRDGAQVDGVVLGSENRYSRVSDPGELSVGATIMRLTLRVEFEDGTTTEVERKLKDTDYGGRPLSEGDIVPMRYDPKDRSQIEIDKAAMKAQRQEELARSAVQAEDINKLQGARKRGEISDEEFTKEAERLLDL
jgi:hypothetical protein